MVHWCLEFHEEGLGVDSERKMIDDTRNATVNDSSVSIVFFSATTVREAVVDR